MNQLNKLTIKNLLLYSVFVVIFFWDIIEKYLPNTQFIFLLLILIGYVFKRKTVRINRWMLLIALFVFAHGIISYFVGNGSILLLCKQVFSIVFCYIVFDSIVQDYGIEEVFSVYWKMCFIMAFIGLLEVFNKILIPTSKASIFVLSDSYYNDLALGIIPRVSSLCNEPSFLGYLLAPAVSLMLFNVFMPEYKITENFKKKKLEKVVILLAYLLTFSSVAYFGLVTCFLLIWLKKRFSAKKLLLVILVIVFALFVYLKIPAIRMRIDDTLSIFSGKSDNVNISSSVIFYHFNMTKKIILNTKGFGLGLGSYELAFDKYVDSSFTKYLWNLNRQDANSMLFRLSSELGIFGIIGIFYILIKYLVKDKNKYYAYSASFLVLFIMLLLRQGSYTHGGSVLFLVLYIKTYYQNKNKTIQPK